MPQNLPFYDLLKSLDEYPQYFNTQSYWLYVGIIVVLLIAAIAIIVLICGGIKDFIDSKTSTKEILTGTLIDKKYTGESSTSGVGTAFVPNSTGGVGVGLVSTSSHQDEQFMFFLKADKVYKVRVNMQQYYALNIGDKAVFTVRYGGITKNELDTELGH